MIESAIEPVMHRAMAPTAELLPTRHGRMVLLRPVRPSDVALLGAFIEGLSQASRRSRFHGGVKALPPGMLRRMAQPDLSLEAALVAVAIVAGQPFFVGEARYAVGEGPHDAREFALVVDDAWQGEGLGTMLLGSLVRHAQWQGVGRLIGDVMHDNAAMLELAQRSGFALLAHPTDARLLRVTRTLGHGPGHAVSAAVVHDIQGAAGIGAQPMSGPR